MDAEVNQSLQSSELAQRLRRRLVESPGVINRRQLPTQHTQNTVSNIIERSTLPDRIQSRYTDAGIVQPAAIAHLFQRSRTEGFSPLDAPLPSPTGISTLWSGTIQRSARGLGEEEMGRWGDGEMGNSLTNLSASPRLPLTASSSGTFRVSRQPSPMIARYPIEASSAEAGSATLQAQSSAESSPSAEMTDSTAMSDLIATPPASTEPGVRVRVQHPSRTNALLQRLSNPGSDRPDAPIETSDTSIQSHTSTNLPLQQVSLKSDRPIHSTANTASTEPASQVGNPINEATAAAPVAIVHHQSQSASLMRVSQRLDLKASLNSPTTDVLLRSVPPNLENITPGQSVEPTPVTPMPLVIARVPVTQDLAESPDTRLSLEQPQSSLPMRVSATPSPPLLLQRQPQESSTLISRARATATESGNDKPNIMATIPASGTPLSQPEMIWRKPTAESAASALPVHETSRDSAIARQTVSEPSLGVEAVSATPATATPAAPETTPASGTSNLDIQQIAQQVSRLLTRQLTVERERRGIRTW